MSLGGGSSKQKSSSESSGFGYGLEGSQTYLDPAQQAAQQGLTDRFFSGMGSLGSTPGLEWQRQNMNTQLGGLGRGVGAFAQGLQQSAQYGANALGAFSQQNNPYLNSQIHGLAQDAGQFFREQLLPGIGSNAQLAGQRGSSRQGIAEGLAADRVGQQFLQSATDLRANAYGQQQQAAQALAGLGIQGANQAYGMAGDIFGQQGGLANQFAQTGLQAQMQPFMIGSQVIGAPSILSSSLGLDYREQQSKSKGTGSSGSLSLGFV